MERERLPIKTSIIIGLFSGLFFATFMATFDVFDDKPFSLKQFIFYSMFFGFMMSISFRYKYTKKEN